jgi:hypothetical protein
MSREDERFRELERNRVPELEILEGWLRDQGRRL